MPTVIRCKRGGRTHNPYYRLVVMDSRSRRNGPEVDFVGIYHPCARPEPISRVDATKALAWLRKGAKASDTARSIFSKAGIMKHFNDGTNPEEEITVLKGGVVEDKGYNAPPPPKEEPKEAPKAESKAEAQPPAAEDPPAAQAPAEETAHESTPDTAEEEKSE
ncbi:MAG: 30S ribosomal protein S16 [Candidatus Hydrogenedentota bacterium]